MKSCTRKKVTLLVMLALVFFSFSANFCASEWIDYQNSLSKRVMAGVETGALTGAQARAIIGAYEGANLALKLRQAGLDAAALRRGDEAVGIMRAAREQTEEEVMAADLAKLGEEEARLFGGAKEGLKQAFIGAAEGAGIGVGVALFEDNIKRAQERTKIALNGYYLGRTIGSLAGGALKSVTGSDYTAQLGWAGALMGLAVGHQSYNPADPAD